MRDAARVWISSDNGVSWDLVATNNSALSALGSADGELPAFASVSRNISSTSNQRVQQLHDNTGGWRQARVDLADFAGQANLQLRFDFTTSGEMDNSTLRDVDGDGDLDPLNNFNSTAFGNFNSAERGQNNDFEGFYIDDIIVGFAERGEMVTGRPGGPDRLLPNRAPHRHVGADEATHRQLHVVDPPRNRIRRAARSGHARAGHLRPIRSGRSVRAIPGPRHQRCDVPATVLGGNDRKAGAGNNVNTTSPINPLFLNTNGRVRVLPTVTTPAYIPPGVPVGDTDETVTEILPFEGTHALYMDAANPNTPAFAPVTGISYATLSLGNLTGSTSAFLSFAYNNLRTPVSNLPVNFSDPAGGLGLPAFGTGIALSENGTDWYTIFTPEITLGAWRTTTIDLVTVLRNAGFTNLTNIRMRIQVGALQVPAVGNIPAQDGTFATGSGIAWDAFRVAVTPAIGSTESIGDHNPLREQGQLILANNTIRNSLVAGIDIQAAPRDADTGIARPGSPIALPTLNPSRLVPGVVIVNNVVTEGQIGINFAGDAGGANLPPAAVPYGRIINNTIVSAATGIRVQNNAGPTLLNNLLSGVRHGPRLRGWGRESPSMGLRPRTRSSARRSITV